MPASTVLMIHPSHFGFNLQTAGSNIFQQNPSFLTQKEIRENAAKEFDAFAELLKKHDIEVIVINDKTDLITPDAVFPNNWFSTHSDGTVIFYPMQAENRRLERRSDIFEILKTMHNFQINKIEDLTFFEKENKFLEGTGSLVFDHRNKIAYTNLSSRTNKDVVKCACKILGYEPIIFTSLSKSGKEIYHTNVILTIADDFAVICSESIRDENERKKVIENFVSTGHNIIEISFEQMEKFAGNMLEVKNKKNESILILSETACNSLHPAQNKILASYSTILSVSIPTIETIGGGSVRCMMAEIFLPKEWIISEPKNKEDFEKYFQLRWTVLRKPWNQPQGSEKDDMEESCIHAFIKDEKGDVIAVGRLQFNNEEEGQVRYMAVHKNYRRKNLGKKILQYLEQKAKQKNASKIILQAREEAVNFYIINNYKVVEKSFILYNSIQHYLMQKLLK